MSDPLPREPDVTVAVLTWNGERYLADLLDRVAEQDYDGDVEVLVIDSGSTDGTLAIVAARPSVRLHEIPHDDFGHGRTRDLAARLARGEIVAYLTHDAVPASSTWLRELIRPMADDARIAAVVGRQVPRPDAPPVLAYDMQRVFERMGPDYGVTIVWTVGRDLSEGEVAAAAFYSDANAAARRSVLTGAVPYRDVAYAEDQLFGRDLLAAGLRKAYAPRAAVEHSNDTRLSTFGRRVEADLMGLREIGTAIAPVTRRHALAQWLKWSVADTGRILVDSRFGPGRKLLWLIANPVWHGVKWSAYRRASHRPM